MVAPLSKIEAAVKCLIELMDNLLPPQPPEPDPIPSDKRMFLEYSPWPAKVVWVDESFQSYRIPIFPDVSAEFIPIYSEPAQICDIEVVEVKLQKFAYPENGGYIFQWVGWEPKTGTLFKRRVEYPNAIPN